MRKLSLFLLAAAAANSVDTEERWYECLLNGGPAGYTYSRTEPSTDGRTLLVEEMRFVMNRLGQRVEVRTSSQTLDDGAGTILSVRGESSSSQQTTYYEAKITSDGIELTTRAADKAYTRTIPVKEPNLSSLGAALLCRAKLKNIQDSVTYSQFMPDFAAVARFTRTLIAKDESESGTVIKVVESNDLMPGKRWLWFDQNFQIIRTEFDLPFGKVVVRQADRAAAMRSLSGSELSKESYEGTLARANVRLPDPRSIEKITLHLTHRKPELGWPAFDSPNQKIRKKTRDTVVLEVSRPEWHRSAEELDPDLFRKPNAILQSDDAGVMQLAASILDKVPDNSLAKARALQDWVAENMKLDLGIAIAPASEVARNRRGTCIAYAVLLASLQRAAGVPSRVAMGYVYTSGIWGGHAWTEALIDGAWLPFDAAAYSPGVADAARFQFGSYTLEDNMAAATIEAAKVYGYVDVAILQYSLQGKQVPVAANARPYHISHDLYENPWLGFSLRRPAGFVFSDIDAVYPETTVVGIRKDGARLKVSMESVRPRTTNAAEAKLKAISPDATVQTARLGGRDALWVTAEEKSSLVRQEGGVLWVLTAEGREARNALQMVASNWKWASEPQ